MNLEGGKSNIRFIPFAFLAALRLNIQILQEKTPLPKSRKKDTLFSESMEIADFKFDEKVARVFDDMLNRSIPFYKETQDMALRLAQNFIQKNTRVYDLGCSTGTVIKKLVQRVPEKSVKIIGIDNSSAMLKKAAAKLRSIDKSRFELRLANLNETPPIENASAVIMNYTLQFVHPLHRETLLRQICAGLVDNGCLILVEKSLSDNSLFNRLYTEIYYDFKKKQGYSDREISQKREALENVLIPWRIEENTDLLKKCGFKTVDIFFKWYNFVGIIAVKNNSNPK